MVLNIVSASPPCIQKLPRIVPRLPVERLFQDTLQAVNPATTAAWLAQALRTSAVAGTLTLMSPTAGTNVAVPVPTSDSENATVFERPSVQSLLP